MYLLNSQINVNKSLTIESVTGPENTIVDGNKTYRCFNLYNYSTVISGLTITNGYVNGDGGGIYCSGLNPIISKCIIVGNSAKNYGGGLNRGRIRNSLISNNSAKSGGGSYSANINNCTIVENSAADVAGGIFFCDAYNSIIYPLCGNFKIQLRYLE